MTIEQLAVDYTNIGSLFVLIMCCYLYLSSNRERYLLYWILGWGLYADKFLATSLYARYGSPLAVQADYLLLVISALFLCRGMEVYVKKERGLAGYLATGAGAVTVLLVLYLAGAGGFLSTVVAYLVAGGIYLRCGCLALRSGNKGLGHKLMGWLFLTWGSSMFGYPLALVYFPEAKIYVHFLSGSLVGLVALSAVIAALDDSRQKQSRYFQEAVLGLSAVVGARDNYTIHHSRHVAVLAAGIARKMGLNAEQVEIIHMAGLLHDIGKVGVPDDILLKPGKLAPTEYDQIRLHPETGYRILAAAGESFAPIGPLVKHHHERWDGSGYPSGLKGGQIPLGAAILSVADAYDAMVSNRPYRAAWPEARALDEIRAGAGTQFQPLAAEVFLTHFTEIEGEPRGYPPRLARVEARPGRGFTIFLR